MQKKTTFETFNDGIVYLYEMDESGERKQTPSAKLRFSNRIVGEGQFYGAMAADKKISRRIRVPMWKSIDEDNAEIYYAVIGKKVYKIIRAQHYAGNNPPCTDLTLNNWGGEQWENVP